MVLVIIISSTSCITIAISKRRIQCLNQLCVLTIGHLIQNSSEIRRQSIAKDALYKHPNDLNVHPGNKGFSIVRLAPPGKAATHTISLSLKLCQLQRRVSSLGWVVLKRTHHVTLIATRLHEFLFEIYRGSGLKLFSLIIPCLILTLENGHRIEGRVSILHNFAERSRNNGRSTLQVSIHSASKASRLSKVARITRPVGSTISNEIGSYTVHIRLKGCTGILRYGDKDSLEVFCIVYLNLSHNIFCQDFVQIHSHEIASLLSLCFLQRHLFIGKGLTKLLQLLINRSSSSSNQRYELLQWTAVGIFGVVPSKGLNVAGSGHLSNLKLRMGLSRDFHVRLFNFAHNALHDGIRLYKIIAQLHQCIQGTNH
mmetsp:Transcript_6769/g.10037  ORF Transcript_6769/g.10037 Transcript_6769/m.10037 type:complete len:369 (-) Transcript_6769:188-1294(-)